MLPSDLDAYGAAISPEAPGVGDAANVEATNKKNDIIAVMQRYNKLADGIITEIEGAITTCGFFFTKMWLILRAEKGCLGSVSTARSTTSSSQRLGNSYRTWLHSKARHVG